MEKLYSPWRQRYVVANTKEKKNKTICPFCTQITASDDEKNFILTRFKHTTVLLNLYPYNAGHLLVLPNKHYKDLQQLSKVERDELMLVMSKSISVLYKTISPDGINVGLNLGKLAGASIVDHLHFHVLPRWDGDTNFLPLLAETKQISIDLNAIYQQIKAGFLHK